MRIGGSLGKLLKKVGDTKIAGVSVRGGLNAALNPGGLIRQAVKDPQTFKSDLGAGARNAAILSPLLSSASGAAAGGMPDAGDPEALGSIAEPSSSWGDRFRSIGMDDLLKYGTAAAEGYGAYKDEARENELFNRERDEFKRRAPLREAGMAGLLDTSRPDLSAEFADQPPRYRRVNVGSR